MALKAIGVTQSEDFSDLKDVEIPNLVNSLSKKVVFSRILKFSLFNKFKIFQIIQISTGGPGIDNQLIFTLYIAFAFVQFKILRYHL